MYSCTEKEFLTLSRKGNLIPVYKEVLADLETPVSAYYKIAHRAKNAFLLESVEGEEKIARYSFVAAEPEFIFETKNKAAKWTTFKNGKARTKRLPVTESPLSMIRKLMAKYKFVEVKGLPRFCGGLVGFLSYDAVRFFERLPKKAKDDLKLPDCLFMLAKDLIIFDHRNHKIRLVSCVELAPKAGITAKKQAYKAALKRIEALETRLRVPLQEPKNKHGRTKGKRVQLHLKSNISESRFCRMIEKAKEDIRAGEIIQVVLSQRFEVDLGVDPFYLYRALRVLNPSPYMYCLKFGKIQIIGSSPELLVRSEEGIVETRPIAGTRPRGKTAREDAAYAKDLLADAKEKAEHIMLVDLGRNDLGRVCEKGSVHLSDFMIIEKYSHVMHIVSNVRGKLRKDKDGFDVLQAAFPAGTLSGAPKIRAMEIIEDLENVTRGPYGGCIGYFSFSGNLDSCITIRTIVVKDKKAYVQAGAGIVADSKPKKEFQETVNKAKAQLLAIERAHNM